MPKANRDAVNALILSLAVWFVNAVGLLMLSGVNGATARDLLPMVWIALGVTVVVAVVALVVAVRAGRTTAWTPAPVLAVVMSVIGIGLGIFFLVGSYLASIMM